MLRGTQVFTMTLYALGLGYPFPQRLGVTLYLSGNGSHRCLWRLVLGLVLEHPPHIQFSAFQEISTRYTYHSSLQGLEFVIILGWFSNCKNNLSDF